MYPLYCVAFRLLGKINLAFNRIVFAAKNIFIKNKAVAEQKSWKNLKRFIPRFQKKYDAAF
jgi:hypothetical protein